MKKCPNCNETKADYFFGKNNRAASGLQVYCKVCQNEMARAAYHKKKLEKSSTKFVLPEAKVKELDSLLTPKLTGVKLQVLMNSIKQLEMLGCKFAIVDIDGRKHGDLEVIDAEYKAKLIRNRTCEYVSEKLNNLALGDVAVLERPIEYDIDTFKRIVTSKADKVFGINPTFSTYELYVSKDCNTIEIMQTTASNVVNLH